MVAFNKTNTALRFPACDTAPRCTSARISGFIFFAVVAFSAVAAAQQLDPVVVPDSEVSAGKELYRLKASCANCHGWAGDGQGDPHSAGNAANLRRTRLTKGQLLEVIACGRLGTAMPHFNAFAYTEDGCYGLNEAAAATAIPPRPPHFLQPREIAAVVAYLSAAVIGKGEPTNKECEEFFGDPRPCVKYSTIENAHQSDTTR